MRRKLLASIIFMCLALQINVTTEATEPKRQIIIPQENFKAIILQTPQAQQTPQPQQVIILEAIPEPSLQVKPTPRKVTVAQAKIYTLVCIGKIQFKCLNILFTKESGWKVTALNKSSGAYGIPQALPGYKMKIAGSNWKTNPITQVKWGLMYIRGRYGSACNALRHFYNYGWY